MPKQLNILAYRPRC